MKTLTLLAETLGDRKLTVCRELTKKHEQIWRTTLLQAISFYQEQEPRGEFALVIGGRDKGEMIREKQDRIRENLSLEDHMRQYLERGLSRKEAMKAVAKERGMAKRDVYRLLLEEDDEDDGIDGSDRAGGA